MSQVSPPSNVPSWLFHPVAPQMTPANPTSKSWRQQPCSAAAGIQKDIVSTISLCNLAPWPSTQKCQWCDEATREGKTSERWPSVLELCSDDIHCTDIVPDVCSLCKLRKMPRVSGFEIRTSLPKVTDFKHFSEPIPQHSNVFRWRDWQELK